MRAVARTRRSFVHLADPSDIFLRPLPTSPAAHSLADVGHSDMFSASLTTAHFSDIRPAAVEHQDDEEEV